MYNGEEKKAAAAATILFIPFVFDPQWGVPEFVRTGSTLWSNSSSLFIENNENIFTQINRAADKKM